MAAVKASVLLVSRAFPPFAPSLGGAVRILKLAEYLLNQGVTAHVLAGSGRRYGDFGYGELLKSLVVHYVRDPMLDRTGPPAAGAASSPPKSNWRSLLRPLVTEIMVPDTGVLAVPRLIRTARRLIEEHGLRNIITSGPPHSDHLVGLALKRRFKDRVNWIVDYRDSWNGTALFRKKLAPLQWLNLALERAVLREADHLTYISTPMRDKMAAIAGPAAAVAEKSALVMNGFDAALAQNLEPWVSDHGPLRIGYFGALDDRPDGYRNPSSLFQAVLDRGLDVRFELFGQIRLDPRWPDLLGNRLVVHGLLPHAESLRRMREFDALMLLHTREDGADEVVTGKLFEYLLAGRPIISIGPRAMAANDLLTELGAGHLVRHDDRAGLVQLLEQLVALKRQGSLPTREHADVRRFARSEQYSRFLGLLSPAAGSA